MSNDPPAASTITVAQAARLLMVSETWVRRLCGDGYLSRLPDGRLPIVGAVQGYIRFLKDDERRASKSAANHRLQDAKAEEVRARIAQKHDELMPIEDAEAVLDDLLKTVRARLAGLSNKITCDPAMRSQIKKELRDALARMADARVLSGEALRTGRDIADVAAAIGAARLGSR